MKNKLSLVSMFLVLGCLERMKKHKNKERYKKRADLKRGKAPYPKNRTTESVQS